MAGGGEVAVGPSLSGAKVLSLVPPCGPAPGRVLRASRQTQITQGVEQQQARQGEREANLLRREGFTQETRHPATRDERHDVNVLPPFRGPLASWRSRRGFCRRTGRILN